MAARLQRDIREEFQDILYGYLENIEIPLPADMAEDQFEEFFRRRVIMENNIGYSFDVELTVKSLLNRTKPQGGDKRYSNKEIKAYIKEYLRDALEQAYGVVENTWEDPYESKVAFKEYIRLRRRSE